MSLTPNKYDKIQSVSRNPYKTKDPIQYKDPKIIQLRIYYKCESDYFKKHENSTLV